MLDFLRDKKNSEKLIVRLTTYQWKNDRSLHTQKTLTYQTRLSKRAMNFLLEDAAMIGADVVAKKIINLYECEDGLYQVTTVNEKYDWETQTLEEYDYQLIPYTPPTEKNSEYGQSITQ
jgi:hypothetical protein